MTGFLRNPQESSGMGQDSSGIEQDSSGMGEDSSGMGQESSGMGQEWIFWYFVEVYYDIISYYSGSYLVMF